MTVNKSSLQTPLYPFLIALAPVVSLFVLNRMQLEILDMVRPAIVYFAVAIVAVTASRIVSRSIRRAALLGCVLLLSFLTYGFAFDLTHSALKFKIQDHVFLLAWQLLTVTIYINLAAILRRSRSSLKDVTIVFNIFGIVVIAAALIPLVTTNPAVPSDIQEDAPPVHEWLDSKDEDVPPVKGWLQSENEDTPPVHEWLQSKNIDRNSTELPDVYYIILDAYARGDVLQSRFDYDNSDFLEWLELKGFFVGHQSHSNYAWTHLSLSATLNGEYLDTLVPNVGQEQTITDSRLQRNTFKWKLSKDFVRNSRVHRFFTNLGYRIISNNSGSAVTRKEPPTLERALLGHMNQLEEALISRSLVRSLIPMLRNIAAMYDLQISKFDRIVGTLEDLSSVADEAGPKFVFYHLLSPHGPFCFDEEGQWMPPHPIYDASQWLSDKNEITGYADWYTEYYPPNIAGLNRYLKEALQSIMNTADGNAIVIIQSDHGPHAGYDLQSAANTDVEERFGILNALYLPADIPRDGLEHTISSVNTFRAVLSNTFDLDLPLLEDRAYYSNGDLDFEEVTSRLHDQAY